MNKPKKNLTTAQCFLIASVITSPLSAQSKALMRSRAHCSFPSCARLQTGKWTGSLPT
jgi:hypothetical protein